MFKKLIFSIITILAFFSCDCTYQYGVYVRNETGEDLKIAYKTNVDQRGEVEETIILPKGKNKFIINSTDLNTGKGCPGAKATDCKLVADYVTAYLGDKKSKIEWCSDAVQFDKTDIQQAEFTIVYQLEDF